MTYTRKFERYAKSTLKHVLNEKMKTLSWRTFAEISGWLTIGLAGLAILIGLLKSLVMQLLIIGAFFLAP